MRIHWIWKFLSYWINYLHFKIVCYWLSHLKLLWSLSTFILLRTAIFFTVSSLWAHRQAVVATNINFEKDGNNFHHISKVNEDIMNLISCTRRKLPQTFLVGLFRKKCINWFWEKINSKVYLFDQWVYFIFLHLSCDSRRGYFNNCVVLALSLRLAMIKL